MFDLFSWSHILILLTVALVVVGPKDLPRLMNIMGRWAGKARDMANEFKSSFEDMARQTELEELRSEVEKLRSFDPVSELNEDVERALNPVDVDETAETDAEEPEAAPAPRSGEYQISEASADAPQAPDTKAPDAESSDTKTADAKRSATKSSVTKTSDTQSSDPPASKPQTPNPQTAES